MGSIVSPPPPPPPTIVYAPAPPPVIQVPQQGRNTEGSTGGGDGVASEAETRLQRIERRRRGRSSTIQTSFRGALADRSQPLGAGTKSKLGE